MLVEKLHSGAFILSEDGEGLSRDNGVLLSGQNLEVGTVLGKIDLGIDAGKFTILVPAGIDGSESAAAILFAAVDASGGDKPCLVIARTAQVFANELTWPGGISAGEKAAAIAELQALGIVVRA